MKSHSKPSRPNAGHQLSIVRTSGPDQVRQTIESLLATSKTARLTGLTFVALDDKGNQYSGAAGVLENDPFRQAGAFLYGAMNVLFSE